jgi:hypothetical protein
MSASLSGMNAKNGRCLSGIDHLRQSLADILTTPIGSRVMRRRFGSLIPALIDQPLTGITVLRLYAATAAAVTQWEPRLRLSRVQLDYNAQGQANLMLEGITDQRGVELAVALSKGGNNMQEATA